MVERIKENVLFVLFMGLKNGSNEKNVRIKLAFDSEIAVSLPLAM